MSGRVDPAREVLPPRRMNASVAAEFEGMPLTICIGFDLAGRPLEVFASGHKSGSTLQRLIDDACVLVSLALQHGVAAEALGKSLGRLPVWRGGAPVEGPASAIGLIVEAVTEASRGEAG